MRTKTRKVGVIEDQEKIKVPNENSDQITKLESLFLQATKEKLKADMNINSAESEKSTVAPGFDSDTDKEEFKLKDVSKLESSKSLSSVEIKTVNQDKVEVKSKMEHNAEDATVIKADPSNVFNLTLCRTETLNVDRSIGALMNCSNSVLNEEFQDNFNLSLQDSRDFN